MDPQIIQNLSFDDYLRDPAPEPSVTSDILKKLVNGAPRTVWQHTIRVNPQAVSAQKTIFDLGSAAHALFVGKGNALAVINEDSYRTNAAKAMRDKAYAAGHTPLLAKDFEAVEEMAEAAELQFSQNSDIRKVFPPADREATILWQEFGVLNRCRPDFYVPNSPTRVAPVIIHYKTGASISAATLGRYAASLGWEITAAHYRAGVVALTGEVPRQFFAVQENKPPYLAMVLELDDIFVASGAMVRELAMGIWATCLHSGDWPGHPVQTVKLTCPAWHEQLLVNWKDDALESAGAKRYHLAPTPTHNPIGEREDEDYPV